MVSKAEQARLKKAEEKKRKEEEKKKKDEEERKKAEAAPQAVDEEGEPKTPSLFTLRMGTKIPLVQDHLSR